MEDAEEKYLPAKVVKNGFRAGEAGVVKTEDGEVSDDKLKKRGGSVLTSSLHFITDPQA